VLFAVLFNALGQLALKAGAQKIGYLDSHSNILFALQSAFNLPILLGLFCYITSVAIWIVALSRVHVSLAYPMLSVGYIIVAICASLYFNEPLSLSKFIAIAIIICGVYLLSRS
jgi:multidrug transporter EmrE-like cation transporter